MATVRNKTCQQKTNNSKWFQTNTLRESLKSRSHWIRNVSLRYKRNMHLENSGRDWEPNHRARLWVRFEPGSTDVKGGKWSYQANLTNTSWIQLPWDYQAVQPSQHIPGSSWWTSYMKDLKISPFLQIQMSGLVPPLLSVYSGSVEPRLIAPEGKQFKEFHFFRLRSGHFFLSKLSKLDQHYFVFFF